eukprot:767159-Hanusia_phi.AAC.6
MHRNVCWVPKSKELQAPIRLAMRDDRHYRVQLTISSAASHRQLLSLNSQSVRVEIKVPRTLKTGTSECPL